MTQNIDRNRCYANDFMYQQRMKKWTNEIQWILLNIDFLAMERSFFVGAGLRLLYAIRWLSGDPNAWSHYNFAIWLKFDGWFQKKAHHLELSRLKCKKGLTAHNLSLFFSTLCLSRCRRREAKKVSVCGWMCHLRLFPILLELNEYRK